MERLDDQRDARPFQLNARHCRCGAETSSLPASTAASDAESHCGYCEICGQPGPARCFPGPLPFEGSWCDEHYELLTRWHPLGASGVLYWSLAGWCLLGIAVYAVV